MSFFHTQLFQYQNAAIPPPAALGGGIAQFESWHQPLSIPRQLQLRIKPALAIALMAASGFIGPVFYEAIEPGPNLESPWHQPWSEPSVKSKIGLKTNLQQFYTGPIAAPSQANNLATWFAPWREPKRFKPGLDTSKQMAAVALDPLPRQNLLPAFRPPLNEPVRLKRRATGLNRDFFFYPLPQDYTVFLELYYAPWRDPVRLPKGLKAPLQQAFTAPPRWLPNPNVFVTLAATETNSDVGTFAIVLYNQARTMRVSIREIRPSGNSPTSLQES